MAKRPMANDLRQKFHLLHWKNILNSVENSKVEVYRKKRALLQRYCDEKFKQAAIFTPRMLMSVKIKKAKITIVVIPSSGKTH